MFDTAAAGNDLCLDCHADASLFEDYGTRTDSLVVTEATLADTPHEGMECTDCHADLEDTDDFPHDEVLRPANCAGCHDDVAEEFATSWHGQEAARRHGDVSAPTCGSCHGTHAIFPADDPRSSVHPKNLPHTCAACHTRLAHESGSDVHLPEAYGRYVSGVHAERIEQGVLNAATCNDCHGYHTLRKASDPLSKVYKYNIPKTCGDCHTEVYTQYERGIHGQALAEGVTDAPNCSDCHGEHGILVPNGKGTSLHAVNLADYACAKCHEDEELVAKYGLKGGRISSYQDSYHGMATKRGSTKAASCVSCHETHDILPATNPASSISPDNIVSTCQKCHPTANREFAMSYSHEAVLGDPSSLKGIIQYIYVVMIVAIIGGMLVHNGIIFFHYIRRKKRHEAASVTYSRFSGTMVAQHMLFASSFIVLVITGFALRFPDATWALPLAWMGISESVRSIIHRVAGVLTIGLSLHHVLYVILSPRGRTEFRHILPTLTDVRQTLQNIRYYLGLTSTKPDFDRYDYTEKAEYWALVWGTVVMVVTGLVLWFPEFATRYLPGWIVIVSETVHYYEAWLAMLSILVWHLFFVIFHPAEYPMSLTWMHGRMSEHELRVKHPAWYRRLAAPGSRDQSHEADEPPTTTEAT